MAQQIARRDLVVGAAVSGAALAVGGVATAQAEEAPAWMPTWDEETDVVVIGYGEAGSCAAIAADEGGAEVIVLEKDPGKTGGNSGCGLGSIHTAPYSDRELWIEKILHGTFNTIPQEDVETIVDYALGTDDLDGTVDWLDEVGFPTTFRDFSSMYLSPRQPGQNIAGYVADEDGTEGRFVIKRLHEIVEDELGLDVRAGVAADELVQDPVTKEVLGVKALAADGSSAFIKARKGVVLACGGYENNIDMQNQFAYPGVRLFAAGTPYNTGDGIRMASGAGARLWHMQTAEWNGMLTITLPSEELGSQVPWDGISTQNYIFVNQFGKRFMNENQTMSHNLDHKAVLDFGDSFNDYLNIPCYLIFDSTIYNAGSISVGGVGAGIFSDAAGAGSDSVTTQQLTGYTTVQGINNWPGNDAAVERGWMFTGETLEELAANITAVAPCGETVGCDGAALAETVAAYNEHVAAGVDPDFGRPAERLAAIAEPPFYAVQISPSLVNTNGGPARNGECMVLSYRNEPIPRLYSAGECGSFNSIVYVFGNNFEALTTGRVAGMNAAALESWDA